MTSSLRGDVPVTLGGRDLVLNFSVDAVIQLEELLDMPAEDIGARIFTDRTQRFKRRFLWAALLERQRIGGLPEFTERQAGELMLEPGSEPILDKLFMAWAVCWPISPPAGVLEDANADASPPTPPVNTGGAGTGKASSEPGASSRSARRTASGG